MARDEAAMAHVAKFLIFFTCLDTIAVAPVIINIFPRLVSLGASPVKSGLIAAIYGATQLFSSPFMGRLADTANRKPLLIICIIICSASYYLLGFSNFITFGISRLLAGAMKNTQLLSMACISDIVPAAEKPTYFGYFGAAIGAGFIIGPLIGGFLAELQDGFKWMCTLASVLFLINALLVWKFLPDNKPKSKSPSKEQHKTQIKGLSGYIQNLGIENCWDVLLLQGLLEWSSMIYFTNLGLILKSDYHLQPKSIGTFIAVASVVGILSAITAGRFSAYKDGKIISVLTGIALISFVGMSLRPNFIMYFIVTVVFQFAMGLMRTWWPDMATSRSKPEKSGAVVGVMHSELAVVGMISPISAGLATECFDSIHGAIYVSTLVCLIAFISSRWFPKQVSKLKDS